MRHYIIGYKSLTKSSVWAWRFEVFLPVTISDFFRIAAIQALAKYCIEKQDIRFLNRSVEICQMISIDFKKSVHFLRHDGPCQLVKHLNWYFLYTLFCVLSPWKKCSHNTIECIAVSLSLFFYILFGII